MLRAGVAAPVMVVVAEIPLFVGQDGESAARANDHAGLDERHKLGAKPLMRRRIAALASRKRPSRNPAAFRASAVYRPGMAAGWARFLHAPSLGLATDNV